MTSISKKTQNHNFFAILKTRLILFIVSFRQFFRENLNKNCNLRVFVVSVNQLRSVPTIVVTKDGLGNRAR